MEALTNPNLKLLKITLFRNIKGYNFGVLDKNLSDNLKGKIRKLFKKSDIYEAKDLTVGAIRDLTKKGIIDFAFAQNLYSFIVELNGKTKIYIAVGCQDTLTISIVSKTLDYLDAYKTLSNVEQELNKELPLSFSNDYGYLTANPLRVGTGLEISAFLTLTNLDKNGKISEINDILNEKGFSIGRIAKNCEYIVKNAVTLGVSEYEIISAFKQLTLNILSAEQELKI